MIEYIGRSNLLSLLPESILLESSNELCPIVLQAIRNRLDKTYKLSDEVLYLIKP